MARFEAEIANEADIKEGEAHKIVWNGRPILLLRKEGNVFAYLDICPHVGGTMRLRGDQLLCQWHGSQFDAKSGKTLGGPAPPGSELIPLPIDVKDGKVYYVFPPDKPRGQWHISPAVPVEVSVK